MTGGLDHLVGRSFGPFTLDVSADRVGAFVSATGEDRRRWSGHAPPMFANVALFTAAPVFLEDSEVVSFTRSLIHSEQSYRWSRALKVGDWLSLEGTVSGVRARGALNLVTFEVKAMSSEGPWLESSSVFVLSEEAAGASAEEDEPAVDDRAGWDDAEHISEETIGPLPRLARSASRADLVRYAGATRDWNPIHWDHGAAVAAGLGGTIVHGLLMAAWLAASAQRVSPGPDPLRSLSLRFRKPLRPARPAIVESVVTEEGIELTLESEGSKLVTGRAVVTL